MRSAFPKLFLGTVLLSLLPFLTTQGRSVAIKPAADLLSDRFGEYKAVGAATSAPGLFPNLSNDFGETSAASRLYVSKDGTRYLLTLITTDTDSGAYSFLTNAKREIEGSGAANGRLANAGVGTDSFLSPDKLMFFKGRTWVAVRREDSTTLVESQALIDIAKSFAETIDKGEGEMPVLVKHLPNWEGVRQIVYAVRSNTLRGALFGQRVFEAVDFEGGAEAVVANYDSGKIVIIEFNTARIAGDNDWNIRTKLEELRRLNQSVTVAMPTAYRRVGNYSVFVFDAASEQAANQLIDQVKYQQVVQWLGENPYLYENAQREFVETTLGVFVAVVKGSGLALVTCFAVGGFLGALLFVRRRAQQRAVEAYSDAGGMVRLNLDEITPRPDPGRLLGRGN